MSAKKLTFEQQIQRLEEIVAALEKGDAQLADSLALFEEVKLMKGPDGAPVELPFEEQEAQ